MNCPRCGHSNPVDVVECEGCSELLVDIFAPAAASHSAPEHSGSSHSGGELRAGSLLGDRYEILELIGEGGMGRVYKVHDRELDKVVALKLIRSEHGQDPVVLRRFKQELLLARNVTHKNVVRLYDFGEADGSKFFTMEWIDGENLKERIRREGKLSVEQALCLILQMASALEEAHRQAVIHRDLKPQNVMIDRNGELHIMDFGIARAADTNTMTATGSVVGTPDYMSPEQAFGEKADQQSDLFSLGIICFEMLTGELPYQGDSPLSRVVTRITKKPTAPRELNAELPAYLENIVLKLMEVDKELRYQSASELIRDLEEQHVDRAWGRGMWRAAHRRKTLAGTAAALIVAAGAVLLLLGREELPSPPSQGDEPVTTLAILPFTNATGASELDWMRTGLPEMLFTDISQSRFVRPVPGERIAKLLRELGVAEMSRFDEATLQSISELAPAQSVLYGQFVESEGHIRLDLSLREAGSGVPTPIKVQAASAQVFTLIDEITEQVKQRLDLTPEQLKGDADRPVVEVSTASLEAREAYQAGLAQLREGANQAAIPLLEKAVAVDSSFAIAHAKLAEAYLNLGEHGKAEAVVERAQALSERSPLPLAERYQVHAIVALANDDYETAVNSYRELTKLYPQDPDIQLSLAQALEELGQWTEAMGVYRRVLDLAPGFGAALMGLGRAQVIGGQPAEAIQALQEALQTEEFQKDLEAMGMVHSILGVAHRDIGRLDQAIEHFNLSLELRRRAEDKRGQAATLANLAAVYEQRGQVASALQAEREAISLAREIGDRAVESTALLNMGATYQAAGELDLALEALRQSMRIEMDRQDLNNLAIRLDWIADIYRIRGQYDDALVYLEQARGYLTTSGHEQEKAFNLRNIGVVKKSLGRYEEAIEALLAARPIFREINQPAGVAVVELNLGEIYSEQGRYADARRTIQDSYQINQELDVGRNMAEVMAHWGHFLLDMGHYEAAKRELDQAREAAERAQADDLAPFILLGKGRALQSEENWGEAGKVLQTAAKGAEHHAQKEIAIRSRIELAQVYLREGMRDEAVKMLVGAREEASGASLRSLEAACWQALAEAHLAGEDAGKAYHAAQAAIGIAQEFSGRFLLLRAFATLGRACEKLGLSQEAVEAFSDVVETIQWIRGNLEKEDAPSFMRRRDVEDALRTTHRALREAGHRPDAELLQEWISN